jgi:hypothetical protein
MIVTDNSKVIAELKQKIKTIEKLLQHPAIAVEAYDKLSSDLSEYKKLLKELESK